MSAAPSRVVVVGASLAGLSTARALRSQGYDGELTVIGDEPHRPYDRPPLSKDFLGSLGEAAELSLEPGGEDLDIAWYLGTRAARLHPRGRGGAQVEMAGGGLVEGDGVVIATGASARRTLPGADLEGVHVLRTLEDARALRADLHVAVVDQRPVVVIGGGFIASEVAATAREIGCAVTLVVPGDAPLRAALGPWAEPVARLHRERGVRIRTRLRAIAVERVADDVVVCLSSGERLRAGTVVLGVGATPSTDWLTGSGVTLDPGAGDAVRCDATGRTGLPAVFAVGDCAAWYHPGLGHHYPIEHWTSAKERGAVVAGHLLGAPHVAPARPPYVWSDLYGQKLQLAGYRALADDPQGSGELLEPGGVADGCFTVVYRRAGQPVAVLSLNQPRVFAHVRRQLAAPASTFAATPPSGAGRPLAPTARAIVTTTAGLEGEPA